MVGGLAMQGKPTEKITDTLRSLVDELLSLAQIEKDRIARYVMGLNGIDFADELPGQHAELSTQLSIPPAQLVLVNDAIIALWGASACPQAVILQHGSGFTAAFRTNYGQEQLFDHLNVGGIFDIRFRLLPLIARMIDGRAETTPLKEKMLRHFNIPHEAVFGDQVYRHKISWHLLESAAALIYQAWQEGDPAAGTLVMQAIDDYACTLKAMMAKTGSLNPDVRCGGGVIMHAPPKLWELLSCRLAALHPQAVIKPPDLPPECGAGILAAFITGLDPEFFFTNLKKQKTG